MNPCEKHEAQDVQESGAGFDCKCCKIERLRGALEKIRDECADPEYGPYAQWAAAIANEALKQEDGDE